MTEQDLFANTNTFEFDPNKNYVDELVGEGKKFSDPNKLAFGKIEADRFIARIQEENEALRKEVTSRQRLEELVTKLSTTTTNNQSTSNDNNQGSERDVATQRTDVTGLTPEQAEQLIATKLKEKENFDKSMNYVREAYGQDYQTKLASEASKLGLDTKEVNTLAKSNPELFQRIFKSTAQPSSDGMYNPSSSVNTNSLVSSRGTEMINGVRTQQYYNNLKVADPKKYWSKEIQQQEYKDAMKLGEAFFNAN